jgi:hypothetical protein
LDFDLNHPNFKFDIKREISARKEQKISLQFYFYSDHIFDRKFEAENSLLENFFF